MIYAKVPAVICLSLKQVLELYDQEKNIQWIQCDYEDGIPKPYCHLEKGKLEIANGKKTNGNDTEVILILNALIKGMYGND